MALNVGKEMTVLQGMTVPELRDRYVQVFGDEPRTRHKQYIIKRIVWRLQALEQGDLSERARQRAAELANDADLRLYPPKTKPAVADGQTVTGTIPPATDRRLPMPGAVITRQYKGQLVEVHVKDDGFEYEGEKYRSLSAIAKVVTGTHWNGYHFFALTKDGEQ